MRCQRLVSWCRGVVALLLIFSCPLPVAGEERVITVGGAQLDLNAFEEALRERVGEELSTALKERREYLEGLPGEAAERTGQFLYGEFKRWVRVQIYKDLPQTQRDELARLEILPNDPRFDPYLEKWLKDKPEVGGLARAYLLEASAQKLMKDLREGASKEIIDGWGELYGDAKEKLKRFTSAVEEAEEGKTPTAEALKKYGFSGPWIDQFKEKEVQFRKLQKLDKKFKAVESLKLLYEAFEAEVPRQKIGAMFGLLEKLGGAAGNSRIPIVSFMGQMVENLAKVASEMLAAEERLAKIIRTREGNCLGADTHDLDDPRQKTFVSQFGNSIQACPTAISPDIYVQTEPADTSKLYFLVKGRFLAGNPEGGGLQGLQMVSRLLEEAAAANFIRYTGKAADPATLAAVYNIPYPREGDERSDEKKRHYGTGIPGVMNEAVAVLDGISSRLDAMEKLVAGAQEQCGMEKLHAFLKSRAGLSAKEYHDAEARFAGDLRLHYVMGYIERHLAAAPGAAASGSRTAAYDTYSRIWEKLEKLSLLRVDGRVVAASAEEAVCRDCAGATIAARASGGELQAMPGCEARGADRHGAFITFYALTAAGWTLSFSAEAAGRRSPEVAINAGNTGLPEPPFVATTEVPLLLPAASRDKEPGSKPDKEKPADIAAGQPEPPASAQGQTGMASVVAGAIAKCDLDLAETLLAGVTNPAERSALERALAERRRQREQFIKVVREAEAEALGDEPYRALEKLRAAQGMAVCERDRELAKSAADRVSELIKAIDDGRYTTWVEDALADCRFDEAASFIGRISASRRGDLEARLREARAREDDARARFDDGRRLVAEGRTEEGLASLRVARAATRCTRQASAIDAEITRAGQTGPRTCDEIMKSGILRRAADGTERCVCPQGKVANQAGTVCMDKPEAQVAARQCPANAEAYWDAEREQARCRCKHGHRYSKEKNACLAESSPEIDKLLNDVAGNRQTATSADQGERAEADSRREKSQYADSGPSSREREPQGPDLMGGLLQALTTAVAQSQGTAMPSAGASAAVAGWQSGSDLAAGALNRQGLSSQNAPRQGGGTQGSGNQASAEDRARWQQQLDCLREGRRKYPNHWQDCNGSFTMQDRDVEIRHLEDLLARSGGSSSSRASDSAGATQSVSSQGGDWFIVTHSAYLTSDQKYQRHPECRYVVGRGMMFIDSVAGGRRGIDAEANALRSKGYAAVQVIYADGSNAERLAREWQNKEEAGRNACWAAVSASQGQGGRR